ncbi:MAG: type II secretion system protein [Rhodoferax sp.]
MHPHTAPSPQAGFTLIELLVVVAVLSAASLLAFGVVAQDHTQIRWDDSRARLLVLYRAVLGRQGPASADPAAGFVADNGALPTDVTTLTQAGTLDPRGPRSPLFDPRPNDSTCASNGGEITLSAASAQLIKGHAGDYLGGMAVNGQFRDGWGNISASGDSLYSGWQVAFDAGAKTLSVTSLGLDNAAGGADYAADTGWALAASDWLLPLAGWTVQVKNWRSSDIAANTLSVSLLVYSNQVGGGVWRRYATTSLPCIGANGSSSGTCAGTVSASFIDGCQPGVTASGTGRIPQGRHLLLLTDNGPDGLPWTDDDVATGGATLSASTPVLAQIDAVAGRNLPAVVLELR